MDLQIPSDHGPWCGCAACENQRLNAVAFELRSKLYEDRKRIVDLERVVSLTGLDRQRVQPVTIVPPVIQAMAPVRERRSPYLLLTVVGMLVALVMMSELLFWFH